MTNTTLFLQAANGDAEINYTALQVRKLIAATYPTEGVLGNGQLKVTQRAAGANMSVDVAPGGAAIKCDTVVDGGTYLAFEDATVNITIPAAPSTGSRTHLIVEQIHDKQSDGGTTYGGKPELVQDTGAGATLPPSAYLLATVTVNHGDASVQNAAITDMRNQAAGPPPDGVVPVNQVTTAAGRITVPHNMDIRPRFASLTMDSSNNTYDAFLVSISSTVVTWELRASTTGSLASPGQNITGSMYVKS